MAPVSAGTAAGGSPSAALRDQLDVRRCRIMPTVADANRTRDVTLFDLAVVDRDVVGHPSHRSPTELERGRSSAALKSWQKENSWSSAATNTTRGPSLEIEWCVSSKSGRSGCRRPVSKSVHPLRALVETGAPSRVLEARQRLVARTPPQTAYNHASPAKSEVSVDRTGTARRRPTSREQQVGG